MLDFLVLEGLEGLHVMFSLRCSSGGPPDTEVSDFSVCALLINSVHVSGVTQTFDEVSFWVWAVVRITVWLPW